MSMMKGVGDRVLLALVLAMCVVVGVFMYLFYGYTMAQSSARQLDAFQTAIELELEQKAIKFADEAQKLERDVLFLASVPPIAGIARALNNKGFDAQEGNTLVRWRQRLQAIYHAYLAVDIPLYQARLIGRHDGGREIVRVEQQGSTIISLADENLQRKGERDYMQQALLLPHGAVHLSSVTLNRERGQIELPERPTLRAVTPVEDAQGKIYGVVAINLDVSGHLRELTRVGDPAINVYMTNPAGHYLIHPQAARAFAFEREPSAQGWADEFTPLPPSKLTEGSTFQRLSSTADGRIFLVAERSIPLGSFQPENSLVLHLALPEEVFLARVGEGAWPQMLLAFVVSLVLAGALLGMYLRVMYIRNIEVDRQREMLETAIDSLQCGVAMVDLKGRMLRVNRALCDAFGYPEHELLGQSVELLLPEEMRQQHALKQKSFTASRPVLVGGGAPVFGVRRDGSPIPLQIGLVKITVGGQTQILASVLDLSQRFAYEEALSAKNAELEVRSREAESASRAKSSFLTNMSHEMRTPLHGIIGLATILQRKVQDAAAQDLLGKLLQAANHMQDVVNNVLDLARIESGKLQLTVHLLSTTALFNKLQSICGVSAASKGLELRIEQQLPELLKGDPVHLLQMLINLVGNAIKFTETGSVSVTASAQPDGPAHWRLHIVVADTGIGMSAEEQARVFDAFEQADGTVTRRFGGSGLGLAITRHLARLMDGDVTVDSAPGEGSRFTLEIRLAAQTGTAV